MSKHQQAPHYRSPLRTWLGKHISPGDATWFGCGNAGITLPKGNRTHYHIWSPVTKRPSCAG